MIWLLFKSLLDINLQLADNHKDVLHLQFYTSVQIRVVMLKITS